MAQLLIGAIEIVICRTHVGQHHVEGHGQLVHLIIMLYRQQRFAIARLDASGLARHQGEWSDHTRVDDAKGEQRQHRQQNREQQRQIIRSAWIPFLQLRRRHHDQIGQHTPIDQGDQAEGGLNRHLPPLAQQRPDPSV